VSTGLVAFVAALGLGGAACSGASGSGGPIVASTQEQDSGSPGPVEQDSGPTPPACSNTVCNGICCESGQTCQSGECTTPGPVCSQPGQSCTADKDCCQTGADEAQGAVCISNDSECHAKCTTGSDCESGCCATVTGESYGVCATSSVCQAQTTACGMTFPTTACASCVSASCCAYTQTCANDPACGSLVTCLDGCNGNTTCESSCIDAASTTAAQELDNAVTCWSGSCSASGC
jgi:hypothetical protein